jgi:hypothetical protein
MKQFVPDAAPLAPTARRGLAERKTGAPRTSPTELNFENTPVRSSWPRFPQKDRKSWKWEEAEAQ